MYSVVILRPIFVKSTGSLVGFVGDQLFSQYIFPTLPYLVFSDDTLRVALLQSLSHSTGGKLNTLSLLPSLLAHSLGPHLAHSKRIGSVKPARHNTQGKIDTNGTSTLYGLTHNLFHPLFIHHAWFSDLKNPLEQSEKCSSSAGARRKQC